MFLFIYLNINIGTRRHKIYMRHINDLVWLEYCPGAQNEACTFLGDHFPSFRRDLNHRIPDFKRIV